jgi:hypothetical protein
MIKVGGMMLEVIESGNALVICEPRGSYGLEGFQLDTVIEYSKVRNRETNEVHYRVKNLKWVMYYEVCSPLAFKTHFKEVIT